MGMTYTVRHSIIATAMWLPFAYFGYPITGAFVGGGFYVIHELLDYFVRGKTHKGRFDYEGMIYPIITVTILTLITLL